MLKTCSLMSMKILGKLSNVEDKLYIHFVQDIAYCLIRPTANKFLTKSREPELERFWLILLCPFHNK